ncbi:MAG TPA: UDP-N-acetylmuramate dehydrogenase [bacterium]|nr:UDP-N-acetylmuramate dehydrogenase [bacterium]
MDLEIKKNINLANYTTFKIGGVAKFFVIVKTIEELKMALSWAKKKCKKVFILGGGSNTLFSDRGFSGLVIKNEIKGLELLSENDKSVIVKAYSGEIWSKLVNFTMEENLYGLENTFYIPGTVGAAPVQNIGAYGTEIKDCFYNLAAINIKTGELKYFNLKDCEFSYRHSIFKGKLKGKYFILWVEFKLSRDKKLNLSYPGISDTLNEEKITEPSLKQLADIIIKIRDAKLPNPALLSNAGSFFKNPLISLETLDDLKNKFPDIKYIISDGQAKIPAAWLIEQCGLKGERLATVGVYDKQALIIVNYGGAKQKDVLNLVKIIKKEVKTKFGLKLEEEVNIL